MERRTSGGLASACAFCMTAHSCLISAWSLRYFSMNSCCLAGGMFMRERELGAFTGLVIGVVDSEAGGGSLGGVPDAGLAAVS